MTNLIISRVCNFQCNFCFAYQSQAHSKKDVSSKFVSFKAFEAQIDFLDRSGIDEVRLIGGEPTLHPHLPELVEIGRRRNKHIRIFSHGLMTEKVLTCLII